MLSTIRIEYHRIFNLQNIILFFIQIFASLYFAWEYKCAFPIDSGYGTFIRTFIILGTFIMMVMGFLTFPSADINGLFKKRYFIRTIFSRLLLLDFYFLLFYGISYGCAIVLGIDFTSEECLVLFDFANLSIVLLNFFYVAGLLLYVINKYKGIPLQKKKIEKIEPTITEQIKRNNILFILVNKEKQEMIFQGLIQGNRHALDKDSHFIMPGEVTASLFIDYACREKKIDRDRVLSNLEILNIPESRLQKKISGLSRDEKKMLISAIVFADEGDKDIVLYDFLKGVSARFEKRFLDLLSREDSFLRRVIYMSSEIWSTADSLDKRELDIENYELFQFEPRVLSLR